MLGNPPSEEMKKRLTPMGQATAGPNLLRREAILEHLEDSRISISPKQELADIHAGPCQDGSSEEVMKEYGLVD